ncbi:hypothetical protein U3516DRAFT_764991 [Neocallimastix sp. 'constans']
MNVTWKKNFSDITNNCNSKNTSKIKLTKNNENILNEKENNNKGQKDLLNSKCNITYGQLLDCSPRIRSDLIKNLKLEKNKNISALNNFNNNILVNNYNNSYISKRDG